MEEHVQEPGAEGGNVNVQQTAPSVPPYFNQDGFDQANNSEEIASLLQGQVLMPDATMDGFGLAGPSLAMPMIYSNGQTISQLHADNAITADDIALYDRQIRLWGMAAQQKIQNAKILLINMRALANEVAKNLVLAGIGSLTLLDASKVTEGDLGAQFFQSESIDRNVGQNRAEAASDAIKKLNPRVQIHIDKEGVKAKGPSYFSGYDIVIATDLDPDTYNIINTATRINGKAFYAAGTHGLFGFIFSDLIEHEYIIERDAGNVSTQAKEETRTRSIINVKTKKEGNKTIESVTKRELYSTWFLASDVAVLPQDYINSKRRLRTVSPALSCLRALWEFMQLQRGRLPSNREDLKLFTQLATQKHKALSLPSETLRPDFLRTFLQNLGSEIAPVAAILGGQLAQDVINVLGQRQQPIQNTVVFDGNSMEALMYPLHPEGNLGSDLLSMSRMSESSMVPNGMGASLLMPGMADASGFIMNPGGISMPIADAFGIGGGFPSNNYDASGGVVFGENIGATNAPPMMEVSEHAGLSGTEQSGEQVSGNATQPDPQQTTAPDPGKTAEESTSS